MKFKNVLITLFWICIWIVDNSNYISLRSKVLDIKDFINLNFFLDTYMGIYLLTYLFIFYASNEMKGINYCQLIRFGKKGYILNLFKTNLVHVLTYTGIYTFVTLFLNCVFVSKGLVFAKNFILFIVFQLFSITIYLAFVAIMGILFWVLCKFAKLSLWLTAITMTLLCYLPIGPLGSFNIFEGVSLIKNGISDLNILIHYIVYLIIITLLLFISIIMFKNKDIVEINKNEK